MRTCRLDQFNQFNKLMHTPTSNCANIPRPPGLWCVLIRIRTPSFTLRSCLVRSISVGVIAEAVTVAIFRGSRCFSLDRRLRRQVAVQYTLTQCACTPCIPVYSSHGNVSMRKVKGQFRYIRHACAITQLFAARALRSTLVADRFASMAITLDRNTFVTQGSSSLLEHGNIIPRIVTACRELPSGN